MSAAHPSPDVEQPSRGESERIQGGQQLELKLWTRLTATAAFRPSVAQPGEPALNVRLRAMNPVDQETALGRLLTVGQVQQNPCRRWTGTGGLL